jgi:hypothetical protein
LHLVLKKSKKGRGEGRKGEMREGNGSRERGKESKGERKGE